MAVINIDLIFPIAEKIFFKSKKSILFGFFLFEEF